MLTILTDAIRIYYGKSRMVKYVNNDLPPAARRRVARYIDRYPSCYAAYRQQQDAAREMRAALPGVGLPEKQTLDRMWSAIQDEMQYRPDARRQSRLEAVLFRLRYGVVGGSMALLLLLPFAFNGNRVAFALSLSQPAPLVATVQPSETHTATVVGMLTGVHGRERAVDLTPPAPAVPQATPISTDD